jgi:hypothetical protein
MASHQEPTIGVRLWPQAYAIARLHAVPTFFASLPPEGAPVALIVGHDEVSLLAPEELVGEYSAIADEISNGWRALTLEAVFPAGTVGLLAVAARALAEVDVPVMVFSSHDTDHFLVPGDKLGRALAALGQARLGRFLAPA